MLATSNYRSLSGRINDMHHVKSSLNFVLTCLEERRSYGLPPAEAYIHRCRTESLAPGFASPGLAAAGGGMYNVSGIQIDMKVAKGYMDSDGAHQAWQKGTRKEESSCQRTAKQGGVRYGFSDLPL